MKEAQERSEKQGLPLLPVLRAVTGLSRATVHRMMHPETGPAAASVEAVQRSGPRYLEAAQRKAVFDLMCKEEYVDPAPAEIYFREPGAGRYHCGIRTMYRILKENEACGARRRQRRHVAHVKPELLATAPNQVWSLDITRLLAPEKWSYFYLYGIMDIFSRMAVGWMIAEQENGANLHVLLKETLSKHDTGANQFKVHSDRGSPMKTRTRTQMLSDLDVTQSFSRPHTSNDNPFPESQFRTAKYPWTYPGRFTDPESALLWGRRFFPWYNKEHRHSGLNYLTPHQVHYGLYQDVLSTREATLQAAFSQHPERFVRGVTKGLPPPPAVGINWNPHTVPSNSRPSKADSDSMEVRR